jgi:hypothetical protein
MVMFSGLAAGNAYRQYRSAGVIRLSLQSYARMTGGRYSCPAHEEANLKL